MAQLILYAVISAALSALATYLLRPKIDSPVLDEAPRTLAERGSFIPIVLGRRRVGSIIGWVGEHSTEGEGGGGGKGGGGGGGGSTVHYENGWHLLCVGPAYALHKIYESGSVIWEGPIYRDSTPSGSTIDCGQAGSFEIYWGEANPSANAWLGDSTRLGISSGWPFFCTILWKSKRLGYSYAWPIIDYEIEVRAEYSALADSPAWIDPGETLRGSPRTIKQIYGPGGPDGNNYIELENDYRQEFKAGGTLALDGNAANADADYDIISVSWDKSDGVTRVFVSQVMTDDVILYRPLYFWSVPYYLPAGTIDAYVSDDNDGLNLAHAIYQLVFESYPHGLGISTDDFNIASLEALGELCETETLYGAFLAEQGEEAIASIAGMMQDIGVLLRFNIKSGLFEFTSVRAPTVTPPNLDDDSLLAPLPEIESRHAGSIKSRLVFSFIDRANKFKPMTYTIDDDSIYDERGHFQSISVEIQSIINYSVAVQVAERRSQEELGNFAAITVHSKGEARALLPGDIITVDGIDETLRLMEVVFDPLSSKVDLVCVIDFYGITASSFSGSASYNTNTIEAGGVTPFKFTELPSFLNKGSIKVICPYLRQNASVRAGAVHISADDSTYFRVHTEQGLQSGGALITSLTDTDPTFIDEGPTIQLIGPDIGEALDLSGDEENWRLGRQICIINDEIFYLKNVTALGGDLYRLDGLIRARYDTVKGNHAGGSWVFIFQNRNIKPFSDLLIQPDKTLYVKVQPIGINTSDLSDIAAHEVPVVGKGVVPMLPANLRTTNMMNAWDTGDDVPLKWTYRSAAYLNSGAGLQGGGDPHATPPIEGNFTLRFYTTGDVLKHEEPDIADPSYTIDNADLVSWFTSEPADFKVSLVNVNAGYESEAVTITITRN